MTGSDTVSAVQVGDGASGTQTLKVDGSSTNVDLSLGAASTVGSTGVLALSSNSAGGYADISGAGGVTVNSGGVLSTSFTGTGDVPAYLETPVTNQAGGTVTIGAPDSRQDSNTLTTNSGTFSVASSANLAITGSSSFTDAAGTLTLTGTMSETNGTFTQSGGTESGNPVDLNDVAFVDSAGTGSFDDIGSGSTLTGTIPVGQTVTVDGRVTNVSLAVTGVTDDGTLALTSNSAGGYAQITGTGSGLTVASGAHLSTSFTGTGDVPVYLETPLTNQIGGTVTIGAPDSRQDSNTLTTNSGAFSVSSGGKLSITGSSSFTDAAGTLAVTGTMTQTNGTFTQSGATESGNPVDLNDVTFADSAGTGSFDDIGSGSTLTGNIPVGQTVTVDGRVTNVDLTVTGVTDHGTLALTSNSAGGYADISSSGTGLTVASGAQLSTSLTGSGVPVYIETPLTNQSGGTVTIGAPDTRQDDNTLTTNAGTLQVVNGGHLTLSSSSTLTNTGTLGVTVNGTAGGISGPGVTVTGSTLAVTTVGSQPTALSVFTPITGPVTGTFSTLVFGANAYAVTYPSGVVTLTAENPFTLAPTAFTPKENEATGAVQVASIGNANDDSLVYSATVNYGDGSGNQTATVATTGATGTVTGPSHTYATNGTYTVTVTVANTNGTTITTTENVTVAGPVITGFSKTSVKQHKKLTTKVSGTGFDTSANVTSAWTTSNPGITVTSAKLGKVTRAHPNPTITLRLTASATAAVGPVSVTLTEDTGSYTFPNAFTVVAS
jgi:anti-anti-sigma regulatory factor